MWWKINFFLLLSPMIRLLFFPFFLFIFSLYTYAQNLIPDPGFEIHNEDCAPAPGLTYWYNPNLSTPDSWCYPSVPCGSILTDALMEELQILSPYEGNCVAGLFVASPTWSSMQTREYLATELVEPLISGLEYNINFRLFRHIIYDAAIDKIGIHFSAEQPFYETHEMLPVEPQVELDTLITTTDEWVSVSRTYVAQGGERFLTVGNFRGHDEMNYQLMGLSWKKFQHSYYFFDDMRLTPLESYAHENSIGNPFMWNGNRLVCQVNERSVCAVYDISGRLVEEALLMAGSTQLNLEYLPKGIYIARITNNSQRYQMKIWKE